MNATKFKADVKSAIVKVAKKHNVKVRVNKFEKSKDSFELKSTITESEKPKLTRKRSVTRKDQVRNLMNKGVEGAQKIADKIGTHSSYVSRLIGEIKKEELSTT